MNILILTARFGMGHIKAAETVKEQLDEDSRYDEVKVIDFVEYLFPHLSGWIYRSFNRLVMNQTGLYNKAISFTDNVSLLPMKAYISWKIGRLIESSNASGVIAIFPCCSRYISVYKEFTGSKIPLYTCITDIHPHSEWVAEDTDGYFAGSQETVQQLVNKGVPRSRIFVTGIPVKKAFCHGNQGNQENPYDRRNVENAPEILVMGGGLGLASSSHKLNELLESAAKDYGARVTVVCGSNEKRKKELEAAHPEFKVMGFVNHVDRLMKDADVLITKPGGITLFEGISSETPLFFLEPRLNQEVYNAKFAEKNHVAKVIWSAEDADSKELMEFICDKDEIRHMKESMAALKKECYGNRIGDIMYLDIKKKHHQSVMDGRNTDNIDDRNSVGIFSYEC